LDKKEKTDEEKTEVSKEEETEVEAEEVKEEMQADAPLESEEISEEQVEEQPQETTEESKEEPSAEKAETEEKKEPKKEKVKKKTEHKEDFRYIVRIANTDLDGEKALVHGLTGIKGVGMHMSTLVADATGIDRYVKIGDLTDAQIEKIKETLENLNKKAPGWMLNRRKDYDTGENIHLISSDIDMRLRDEINIMKKIRSYKGVRHESGLPVRGQRTRAHGRSGLAMGVSRKGVLQAAKASSSETKDKE
jgi:small subunit ribosomal protein S13